MYTREHLEEESEGSSIIECEDAVPASQSEPIPTETPRPEGEERQPAAQPVEAPTIPDNKAGMF